MNTKTNTLHYLILGFISIIILLIQACGPTKPKIVSVNPGFSTYISGYTSGMVSKSNSIRIELAEFPNEKVLRDLDSNSLNELISFDPEIKGHAIWSSDRTIEFVPDEQLASNQLYTAELDLDKIVKVKDGFESFVFQFATYKQEISIEDEEINYYDYYNRVNTYFSCKIATTDIEDSSKIRNVVQAFYKGKKLPLRIEPYYDKHKFNLYFDSITRTNQEEYVVLKWDGASINSSDKGIDSIRVSALGDFSISTCNVQDNGDQSVEISFSEPIQPLQYLDGIITIDGIRNLTFSISENSVNVFLPNRIIGQKTIHISSGLKNYAGHKMNREYQSELSFEAAKPMIRIKGNGSILPNSNGLIFPFEAIGINAVDVRVIKILEHNVHHFLQVNNLNGNDNLTRFGKIVAEKTIHLDYDKNMNLKDWNSHVLDLNKLIQPDPGAIYRVCLKTKKEYALCDCEKEVPKSKDIVYEEEPEESDPDWSEENWEGYGFGGGYDTWYYYSPYGSPCEDDYYDGLAVGRNILASNIGVICKIDDQKKAHAIISDMITTEPIANAEVTYYDFIKQTLATGKTDANGMFDITLKQKPFLLIVKYGKQRGYLKLSDEHSNSLSKFDVEGDVAQKGLKGYIYGERGVWRPGDSLFLYFILEDKSKNFPDKHPIHFALFSPTGVKVDEYTTFKHVERLYSFKTKTGADDPTGNYCLKVKVGNRLFTKNIKIETIQPNRLKIYMDLAEQSTIKSKGGDSIKLNVKWLHGAIAKNLHTTIGVKLSNSSTTFKGFTDYCFDSPLRKLKATEEQIYDGNLDKNGETKFTAKLQNCENAPGKIKVAFITKVYEQSGNFSIDRRVCEYSPFTNYVGISSPNSSNYDNTLETGVQHKFDVVSLDENGKLSSSENLEVKIYKLEWKWWYEKDKENWTDFNGSSTSILIKDTILSTKTGRTSFKFGIKYPDYGRFLITVKDPKSNHQAGKIVSIDWPYWSRGNRTENENASMLNFACDKETYRVGEKVKISFPSPSVGRALVSIETRTKILKKYWIKTVKGETMHSFEADATMSPNVYIHITLIQPHANTKNDLPIRMYGIIPIMVDDPKTHLSPIVSLPEAVRPESTFSINVKEEKGKKMVYTLALVDDGLLDLTNFKTPQPWYTFYSKEALGVKTWDMYSDVIGAYSGRLDRLLSVGGDGENMDGKAAKANRFKPVVKHLGPFVLEAGQSKSHRITLPNYVGSVRVMVVAQYDGSYGSSEKTVRVKKPLMVLSTLPRMVGPNETVYLPVDVFAMEKNIKNVHVKIQTNEYFTVEGKSEQSIQFQEEGDEVVNFKLKVLNKVGVGNVKIWATSGNEKANEEIEIEIKIPNISQTESNEIILNPGEKWNGKITFKGIEGTNSANIECSNFPSISLDSRLNYLIQYPHGCIEQTTSSVFPQLYLSNLLELSEVKKEKIANNIKSAIQRIKLFQTSSGGFSYWPGESYASEWGTNYAGHFIIEAEKQGYSISTDLKTKWVEFQQQKARNWNGKSSTSSHWSNADEVTQAYRLYVLALAGAPELGAMNRMREDTQISTISKWRLASAYQLVGQEEVAKKLVDKLSIDVVKYRELSYSYGSDFRDKSMILESLSTLNMRTKALELAKELAQRLSGDGYLSTQETAYSLLAICKFSNVIGGQKGMSFNYKLDNKAEVSKNTTSWMNSILINEKEIDKEGKVFIQNKGKTVLFVKVNTKGVPKQNETKAYSNQLELAVKYYGMNGNEINPEKIIQGTDFKCEVILKNPTSKRIYKELALNQLFASGWEIHNSRMDQVGDATEARYQDIRDDRVYSYIDLAPNTSKKIIIQLNATYLGKFYLPSFYAEAMYDNSIKAATKSSWVEVLR